MHPMGIERVDAPMLSTRKEVINELRELERGRGEQLPTAGGEIRRR